MIVEDDPVTRQILARSAAEQGFQVTACADAESGWDFFLEERPHLVILDWLLPGMNGTEFCRMVRQHHQGRYVAVLMITARDEAAAVKEALDNGADFYLAKPIDQQSFQVWLTVAGKRVREYLEHAARDARIERYRQELEGVNEQLETAISRANQLAMQAELAYTEINQIFNSANDGIRIIDLDANVLRCNETFLRMTGITKNEALARKCHETFGCQLCHTPECSLKKVPSGTKRIGFEIEKQTAAGAVKHFAVTVTPFKAPDGALLGIIEYILDITQRVTAERALKESERKYRELSTVDELTRLFNKRHFNYHLNLEVGRTDRYKHPLSLLLMDIDNFKHHNDTYGHVEGDKVLARLGEIVKQNIRENDLACRYGGEEFAVILPETAGESAVVVAERLREKFAAEEFYPWPDEMVRKTISIGIAQYIDGEGKEQFISRTDRNLYLAKEQGKNRSVLG